MRFIKLVALAAPLLALAGCETLGLSSSEPAPAPVAGSAPPLIVAEPCPLSAVLSEASKVTLLRGSSMAAADVVASAEMSPPRLECEYDSSTRVDEIDLNFPLVLTKGPAAASDTADLVYFVALVNMANEVIAKRIYQRRVDFQGKQSFIATESVENLVLTLGPGTRPTDHRILIGFQLTPQQLAYNRMKASQPPPPPAPPTGARPAPARGTAPGATPVPAPAPTTPSAPPPQTTVTPATPATGAVATPTPSPAASPSAAPPPASSTATQPAPPPGQ